MLSGGSASVVDFGIAKAISAARTDAPGATLTQIGTSIGTPAYMAPEQAAGDPSTDFRADLYAFGCTAYEALTGRPPFVATSPHKLLAAHMSEAPEPITSLRPDTPDALASLIHQCLAKDPEHRPESASVIVRQLDSITSGSLPAMPSILIGGGGPGMLKRALVLYAVSFALVAIVAKAAIVAIGLPDWVFPGSLIVMALGLPVILFTGYVHRTTRRFVSTTPQLTPGGSPSARQSTMQTLAIKASPHMSWRRTMLGGAIAVGGFTLLVGAFMVLRAFGIGPAGSLLAAGRMNARDQLVVTDFTVTNADTTLGRVLSDAAKTQLAQSSVITLMSPEGVADALRRMERPANSNLDLALARELAQRNGVRVVVDGSLTGLGANAGYILTMKLVTADSARELASFRETSSTAQGLIQAVDRLARDLRGRVGESLKRVREAPQLARATTSSLDALVKYTQGVRLENIDGQRAQAIAALTEAVTIDSTFAEAWRKLGITLSNAGRAQQRDSALAAAYRHRMRVPEPSRSWIVAAYFHNGPGRDRAKAAQAYESAMRAGDSSIANNLAILLGTRREFARAESLYSARIRVNPREFRQMYASLALSQRRQQKFDAADSTAAAGLKEFPDLKENLTRSAFDAQYRRGDTAAYRRTVDSMFTRGDSSARQWARSRVIGLMRLDGQLSRAEATVAQNRPANPTPRQRLNWTLDAFYAWTTAQWRKQPATLEKQLDEAFANYTGQLIPSDYIGAASRYAWAERPAKGREMLARFEREVKDTAEKRNLRPDVDDALSNILIAEGKGGEAVLAARRADREVDGPATNCVVCIFSGLARAFDRAGTADSAIKYYDAFISTYDWEHLTFDQILLAQYNRRLGELYEQRGDKEKASKHYLNFVNLWKNADPELQPQVAEVRRRLARLGSTEPLSKP